MIFVPLPFVVALLLALMCVALVKAGERTAINRPFLALMALCAAQSIGVGLRWGYGVEIVRYMLPVVAAGVPPLVHASFRSLMNDPLERRARLFALLPPLVMAALVVIFPAAIDFTLMALFLGYAAALGLLGRAGPDGLDEADFASAGRAHHALYVAAAALSLSAGFDLVVMLDFDWTKGAHAAAIVGYTNLLNLLLIGLTARIAAASKVEPPAAAEPPQGEGPSPATQEDRDVLERLERLMEEQRLYRDENLTLARLARRAGLPGRRISSAINRLTGMNVSQYVNGHRIKEACRQLEETDQSVTAVMLASGFQTKSNFNREFRRVTGLNPIGWRERSTGERSGPVLMRQSL